MYVLSEFQYIENCLNVNLSPSLNVILFTIHWEERSFLLLTKGTMFNGLQINNILRHVLFINTPCSLSFVYLYFLCRRKLGEITANLNI